MQKKRGKDRAQVTIFFILGVIILLSVLLFVWFEVKLSEFKKINLDIEQPVRDFFDACLHDSSKEAITKLAEGSGFLLDTSRINAPDNAKNPVYSDKIPLYIDERLNVPAFVYQNKAYAIRVFPPDSNKVKPVPDNPCYNIVDGKYNCDKKTFSSIQNFPYGIGGAGEYELKDMPIPILRDDKDNADSEHTYVVIEYQLEKYVNDRMIECSEQAKESFKDKGIEISFESLDDKTSFSLNENDVSVRFYPELRLKYKEVSKSIKEFSVNQQVKLRKLFVIANGGTLSNVKGVSGIIESEARDPDFQVIRDGNDIIQNVLGLSGNDFAIKHDKFLDDGSTKVSIADKRNNGMELNFIIINREPIIKYIVPAKLELNTVHTIVEDNADLSKIAPKPQVELSVDLFFTASDPDDILENYESDFGQLNDNLRIRDIQLFTQDNVELADIGSEIIYNGKDKNGQIHLKLNVKDDAVLGDTAVFTDKDGNRVEVKSEDGKKVAYIQTAKVDSLIRVTLEDKNGNTAYAEFKINSDYKYGDGIPLEQTLQEHSGAVPTGEQTIPWLMLVPNVNRGKQKGVMYFYSEKKCDINLSNLKEFDVSKLGKDILQDESLILEQYKREEDTNDESGESVRKYSKALEIAKAFIDLKIWNNFGIPAGKDSGKPNIKGEKQNDGNKENEKAKENKPENKENAPKIIDNKITAAAVGVGTNDEKSSPLIVPEDLKLPDGTDVHTIKSSDGKTVFGYWKGGQTTELYDINGKVIGSLVYDKTHSKVTSVTINPTNSLIALNENERIFGLSQCCPPKDVMEKLKEKGICAPELCCLSLYDLGNNIRFYEEGEYNTDESSGVSLSGKEYCNLKGHYDSIGGHFWEEENLDLMFGMRELVQLFEDLGSTYRVLPLFFRPTAFGIISDKEISELDDYYRKFFEVVDNDYKGTVSFVWTDKANVFKEKIGIAEQLDVYEALQAKGAKELKEFFDKNNAFGAGRTWWDYREIIKECDDGYTKRHKLMYYDCVDGNCAMLNPCLDKSFMDSMKEQGYQEIDAFECNEKDFKSMDVSDFDMKDFAKDGKCPNLKQALEQHINKECSVENCCFKPHQGRVFYQYIDTTPDTIRSGKMKYIPFDRIFNFQYSTRWLVRELEPISAGAGQDEESFAGKTLYSADVCKAGKLSLGNAQDSSGGAGSGGGSELKEAALFIEESDFKEFGVDSSKIGKDGKCPDKDTGYLLMINGTCTLENCCFEFFPKNKAKEISASGRVSNQPCPVVKLQKPPVTDDIILPEVQMPPTWEASGSVSVT